METAKPTTISAYIATFPAGTQSLLRVLRKTIKAAAPGAEEAISYGIPTFRLNNRYLVYFAGFKKHVSVYSAPAANKGFEKDYEPYYTSGKGTIQFPLDKPLPLELITKIVKYRIAENAEIEKNKITRKKVK